MKITELNIVQFGKFKDRVFNFEDGFNIVRGDNESGKSTILAFIKFMLYGVGRKNPNVTVGERERALSWETGTASGSLTFTDDHGRLYRIERIGREGARGTYADRVRVLDLHTGADVSDCEVPGEYFLGISAQAFDSMCNMRQLECTNISADALRAVIDNMLSGGDENTDVATALKSLDTERRRLMHANGKGGLVFETELELERLRSEYRGAIIADNEAAKARDELGRVELALKKSQDEHALAQKMCDLCDDVVRLEKFDELRALAASEASLRNELAELKNNTEFNPDAASFEMLANISSASASLRASHAEKEEADKENAELTSALEGLSSQNSDKVCELIDEFGSPRSAVAYLSAKQKKKSGASFMFIAFGACAAVLFAFAAILAFAMGNGSGGTTVTFIGALIFAASVVFYKQNADAKKEISAFSSRLSEELASLSEDELRTRLEEIYENRSAQKQKSAELVRSAMRVSLADEKLQKDVWCARELLQKLGIPCAQGKECDALDRAAESMREYLNALGTLEGKLRDNMTEQASLKAMLERFSESDIRARITPEIEEKIKNTPHERLKSERDLALHRVNQYSQYKAGIERTLLSGGSRRSPDEIYPEIEAEKERLETLKLRLDAIKLAAETINSASSSLKSDITPRIKVRAQDILSALTSGKYSELLLDENMSLSVYADGATRPIDYLSKGTLDAAYFALRLALTSTLTADKTPPCFMDESLSQLDDTRAENMLRAIAEYAKDAQCILFTCQSRDVHLARGVCEPNIIEI